MNGHVAIEPREPVPPLTKTPRTHRAVVEPTAADDRTQAMASRHNRDEAIRVIAMARLHKAAEKAPIALLQKVITMLEQKP